MNQDTRDIKTICLNCFNTLDKKGVCPYCGKKADDGINPSATLPMRTFLKERYVIGKVLGVGGFGLTYLGWDTQRCAKVAIKEFFPRGYVVRIKHNRVNVKSPDTLDSFNHWLKAFVQEAQMLTRINHLQGVVKIQDYFEENGTAYIVMEYLEGVSLRNYLTTRGHKIPVDEALRIMRPLLEALIVLHQYGVIHRDISPENIQIVENRYVKLIDFGAAQLFNAPPVEKPFVVLKPGYSPIESYYPKNYKQGPWTDVYQVGATIYNSITGYIPSSATDRAKADNLPRPSALGAHVAVAVENAIMKAMALYPQNRYTSAAEFKQMLYGEFMPWLRKRP